MDKDNVSGRKTCLNPPLGDPTSGSNIGKSKRRKKRKKSDNVKTGDTPESKLQNLTSITPQGDKTSSAAFTATEDGKTSGQSSSPAPGASTGKDSQEVEKFSEQDIKKLLAKPNSPSGASNSLITEQIMASPTKSTSSVSSALKDCRIREDGLDDDDVEIGDLTQEELDEIEASETGKDKGDTSGEPKPKAAKTWASVAKKSKSCFEILYIHSSVDERLPIEKEMFYKLYDRINVSILDKILKGEKVPDGIAWHSWSKGRGLVATKDQETTDWVIEAVKNTTVQKLPFCAWKQGSFSRGRLVTGHIKGNATKSLSHDKVMKVLIDQNGLKGNYTGVAFTDSERGRLMRFYADSVMWADLLARREIQGTSKLNLMVGWTTVEYTLSRKPKTSPGEDEGSQGMSVAAPAPGASADPTTVPSKVPETTPGSSTQD